MIYKRNNNVCLCHKIHHCRSWLNINWYIRSKINKTRVVVWRLYHANARDEYKTFQIDCDMTIFDYILEKSERSHSHEVLRNFLLRRFPNIDVAKIATICFSNTNSLQNTPQSVSFVGYTNLCLTTIYITVSSKQWL